MPLPTHLAYNGRTVLLKYHRLLSGIHPHAPNSVAALRHLVEEGAACLEVDIRLTADGAYVLLHDETLERETSGVGPVREITRERFTALRLRGSEEPAAALDEIVAVLRGCGRELKLQVDLAERLPLSREEAARLADGLAPLREPVRVVVGCMADWNLRALRRVDPTLPLAFDIGQYLDAPVDGIVRLPLRTNAYGYLDDHPLGYRRLLAPAAYLEDRLEALVNLVDAGEYHLRKDFLVRALADGFNPVAFIHGYKPGAQVDVWTVNAGAPDFPGALFAALDAGADQITTDTAVQLAETLARARS